MAIIKCDDVVEEQEVATEEEEATQTTVEPYVEQDEVSIGKTLLAVESGFFLSDTLNPIISDISTSTEDLLKTRPQDISDSFRAESNRYWTLDENGNMKYMNANIEGYTDNVNIISPTPPFKFLGGVETADGETELGLPKYEGNYTIMANSLQIPNDGVWKVLIERGTYLNKNGEEEFSRPTELIPTGQIFTDHAFAMNTPFSKKELEMFANIAGVVSVADVESDYDFYAKAYEEGIASATVPENALPHLYTEVQKSENTDENTTELPKGYLRSWVSEILSNSDEMRAVAKRYEIVAILDSIVDEENIIDSTSVSTSAFDILMAYANRENLFPMNVNIEVDTNNASDLMFEAEDVGMVDDIVRMLMGDGSIVVPQEVPTIYDEEDESTKTEDTPSSGEDDNSAMPGTEDVSLFADEDVMLEEAPDPNTQKKTTRSLKDENEQAGEDEYEVLEEAPDPNTQKKTTRSLK